MSGEGEVPEVRADLCHWSAAVLAALADDAEGKG